MSLFVGHVEPFTPGSSFAAYEDRLLQYFAVNEVEEGKKVALFITVMGADIYEILMSLTTPALPSKMKFSELLKKLRDHFQPKKNKRAERFRFHKAHQDQGETISDFVVRLKAMSQTCFFGDFIDEATDQNKYKNKLLDDVLADKFIVGLQNEHIRQSLLNNEYDFEKCCTVAVNMELSEKESKSLDNFASINRIDNNNKSSSSSYTNNQKYQNNRGYHSKRNNKSNQGQESSSTCRRCGLADHTEDTCPAKGWTCYKCNRMGHTSKVCFSKSIGEPNMNTINSVSSVSSCNQPLSCVIMAEGKQLVMNVDTGACVTIMCKDEYISKFNKFKLTPIHKKMFTVSGQNLHTLGQVQLRVIFGMAEYVLELVVVDVSKSFTALIGRNWLNVLIPNWKNSLLIGRNYINSVSSNQLF